MMFTPMLVHSAGAGKAGNLRERLEPPEAND
jgi:hypothetical protein